MIKKIICMLCTLWICFGMISIVCDAEVFDSTRSCSLTLSYNRGESAFSNLNIDIYRVAKLCNDGTYELLEPFSNYPIKIYGITSQKEWQDTAQTIKNYVSANQVEAYQSQKTNEKGQASFVGLETGLYMVKGITAQDSKGYVVFFDFMVYLPTPVEDGYDYDVEARPKYTEYIAPEKYTVVKLWKDSEDSERRPESITVEILKNGKVQESILLNSENNWSYSWEVSDKDGVWSVIEKEVPDGYQVSITKDEMVFVITNSMSPMTPDDPEKPESNIPTTGDTSPLLLYVIILCVSGFGLILLCILRMRERRNEKKR